MPRKKIGLALSGGGARGLAHIGILKILHNSGIPIDCISGTSMGGLIAAAYACGIPISRMEEKAMRLSRMRELVKLVDLSSQRRGLLEGNRVRDFLCDLFLDRTFASLKIPLALPAVDLVEARQVVFSDGMVFPAVLATIAVPGLFKPYELGGRRLVDGGILNNLPVDLARGLGAEIVIAVDVLSTPEDEAEPHPHDSRFPLPVPEFFLDFYRAEMIMIDELTRSRLRACPPDLLLNPFIPARINMISGFPHAAEIITAGERCAEAALPQIRALVMDALSHEQEIQPEDHQRD